MKERELLLATIAPTYVKANRQNSLNGARETSIPLTTLTVGKEEKGLIYSVSPSHTHARTHARTHTHTHTQLTCLGEHSIYHTLHAHQEHEVLEFLIAIFLLRTTHTNKRTLFTTCYKHNEIYNLHFLLEEAINKIGNKYTQKTANH